MNLSGGEQGGQGILQVALPRRDRAPDTQYVCVVRRLRECLVGSGPRLREPPEFGQRRCYVYPRGDAGQAKLDRGSVLLESLLPPALLRIQAPQAVENGRVLGMGPGRVL